MLLNPTHCNRYLSEHQRGGPCSQSHESAEEPLKAGWLFRLLQPTTRGRHEFVHLIDRNLFSQESYIDGWVPVSTIINIYIFLRNYTKASVSAITLTHTNTQIHTLSGGPKHWIVTVFDELLPHLTTREQGQAPSKTSNSHFNDKVNPFWNCVSATPIHRTEQQHTDHKQSTSPTSPGWPRGCSGSLLHHSPPALIGMFPSEPCLPLTCPPPL